MVMYMNPSDQLCMDLEKESGVPICFKRVVVGVFASLTRTCTEACFPALVFIYSNSLNLWFRTFLEPS